jgi:hypothetical protein
MLVIAGERSQAERRVVDAGEPLLTDGSGGRRGGPDESRETMKHEAAADHYAKLLSQDSETISLLTDLSRTFTFTNYTLCRVLQPFFIDAETYAEAMQAAASVFAGLIEIVSRRTPGLARSLQRQPRWAELLDGALSPRSLLGGRVDTLLTPAGFKVLEFNPFTPSVFPFGIECSEPLASRFAETPVMRELMKRHACRIVPMRDALFETLVATHVRRGRSGLPNLAIIDVPFRVGGVPAAPDPNIQYPDPHTIELFGHLSRRGLSIQLCDLDSLRYEGGVLSANDTPIDLAFISGDHDFFEQCSADSVLLRAIRDGAVGMGDGYPLGSVLDDKRLLADLSDPEVTRTLEPSLAKSLERCVPWTRRLSDESTTYAGSRIRLHEFVRDRRASLVLKPAFGFGGKGVFLGWQMSQEEWAATLASIDTDYVVQERVVGGRVRMPYLEGGVPVWGELPFDLAPYVWSDGHAEGCMVRVSTSEVMNITRGATMAPVFVLD